MLPELKDNLRSLLATPHAKIHLIGIAGSGMSGLARLLHAHDLQVSGSDLRVTPETKRLEDLGVSIFQGHACSQIEGAQLVVYSSAIAQNNIELEWAHELGIPCALRAECLAVLAERKKPIVVAGMHGKTTAAAMLTYVLRIAGWRSAHYIGAEIPLLGASAVWDRGEHLILEGDESDGTISLYYPHASLLLNIEEEHLDYFGDIGKIMETFSRLVEQTSGPVIYCADDKNTVLVCSHRENAVGYGFSSLAQFQILDVQHENFSSRFKLLDSGKLLGEIQINVPGLQNVSNAAGVAAVATQLGVHWDSIVEALAEYRGAKRRFEVKSTGPEFMVVDDYAHHPTEIRATLAAARNSGWKRVIALFQPHRYTRTRALLEEFSHAFEDADAVFLTEIYPASEQPIPGVNSEALAERIRKSGHPAVDYRPTLKQLRREVCRMVQPGDMVLTMGAGDIHQVATQLAQELSCYQELRQQLKPESQLRRQEPLSKHTSMRIGGPADLWFEPTDEEDLCRGVRYCHAHHIPVTLIGRGTNLLILDGGIRGLCVHLGQPYFSRVHIEGKRIEVGAGVRLKNLVATVKKAGLGGLEFLEGIPGNLGGALRMNAGAMKGWTMDLVEEVRTVDRLGNIHTTKRQDLEVFYRDVPHFSEHMAVSALLHAEPTDQAIIEKRLKDYSQKRWSSQPAASSAGCIFKNPETIPAGKLLDELGLKNFSVGEAHISEVHANFVVNKGGARASDVLELIAQIQEKVKKARQIDLKTEVVILGESE